MSAENTIEITKSSYFQFSGGEVHVRLTQEQANIAMSSIPVHLVCLDYTAAGLIALCQYVEILRRYGVEDIRLTYPYLPYARQDRVIEKREPFSLKVFATVVNALKFSSVTVWDPHSDVVPALIERCCVVPQWDLALKILGCNYDTKNTMYISPDAGAYRKLSKLIADDSRIAIGLKARGEKGAILRTEVLSPVPLKNRECMIVDDICDGGRTFIELSKRLWDHGATWVGLYVTHGIFSKGFDELRAAGVCHIYTTNSFFHESLPTDFVTVKAFI